MKDLLLMTCLTLVMYLSKSLECQSRSAPPRAYMRSAKAGPSDAPCPSLTKCVDRVSEIVHDSARHLDKTTICILYQLKHNDLQLPVNKHVCCEESFSLSCSSPGRFDRGSDHVFKRQEHQQVVPRIGRQRQSGSWCSWWPLSTTCALASKS